MVCKRPRAMLLRFYATSLLRLNCPASQLSAAGGNLTLALRHYSCSHAYRGLCDHDSDGLFRTHEASGFGGREGALRFDSCSVLGWRSGSALSALSRREYSNRTSMRPNVLGLGETESYSSTLKLLARRSSTVPDKPREEPTTTSAADQLSTSSEQKTSRTQQLRKLFKEYGAVGVSFHVCLSLVSLGICYLAVSSGVDMAAILCSLGFSESVVQSKMAAGTSTFVVAYAVHKLFAPLRISITLVSVPLIIRHLRKSGLFKPRTSGP